MRAINSRGSEIDIEQCVAKSGSRYDVVLIGAQRLRELKRIGREDHSKFFTCVDALKDIQSGLVKPVDYLAKVK